MQATESVSELEGFAAVVYSSNFEVEAGLQMGSISDSSPLVSEDEAGARANTLEGLSAEEAEEALGNEQDEGVLGRATGILDAAWGGFGNAWGRVLGRI